jgi:hypothetical protein
MPGAGFESRWHFSHWYSSFSHWHFRGFSHWHLAGTSEASATGTSLALPRLPPLVFKVADDPSTVRRPPLWRLGEPESRPDSESTRRSWSRSDSEPAGPWRQPDDGPTVTVTVVTETVAVTPSGSRSPGHRYGHWHGPSY